MSVLFLTDIKRRKLKKIFSILLLFVFIFVNFFGFNINTARAADAWWNVSYGYRVKITINASQVPSTQTSFPVYVNLANLPAGFFSHVQSDGRDIRVTNSAGTELARQIETINTGASTGELWFKADSISDSAYYYIYYGNSGALEPAATDADGSQHVWDDGGSNNYKAVWHLKEASAGQASDYKDSTSNSHNSTNTTNEPSQVDGKIGKAQSFNGTSQRVAVGNITNPTNITVSAWINVVNNSNAKDIFTLEDASGWPTYIFRVAGTNLRYGYAITSSVYEVWQNTLSNLPTGSFVYVSAVQTGNNTPILYINGAPVDVSVQALAGSPTKANTLLPAGIGAKISTLANFYKGTVDEIRVSDTVRSADWIKTEFNNQSAPTSFYQVASQEAVTVPDAPTGLTPTVGNTQISLSWTAPANGGSPIDDYVVDYKLHSDSSWTTFADGTSINTYATVINLTNGSSYDFRVSAHNVLGTGSPSATATATPATVPSTPAKGTATKGNASASVAFTPPQ